MKGWLAILAISFKIIYLFAIFKIELNFKIIILFIKIRDKIGCQQLPLFTRKGWKSFQGKEVDVKPNFVTVKPRLRFLGSKCEAYGHGRAPVSELPTYLGLKENQAICSSTTLRHENSHDWLKKTHE